MHIYPFKFVQKMTKVNFLLLYYNTWNHLTVFKQMINRIIGVR